MADMRREPAATGPIVTGFAGTAIVIDGVARSGAVILTPDAALDWDGQALDPAAALDPLPEFILYGTGPTLERPTPAIVAQFEARGIGIEAMDTRAAARAWTLLRGEGRWISAALKA
jgi:uncharacterized protein